MGQVPDDLNEISAVEKEVDTLRERTQSLVTELERRLRARAAQAKELMSNTRDTVARVRHAVDVRAQIHEHPRAAIGVGSAATIAIGLGVYFTVARMVERRKPMNKLKARAHAYRALLADPHRALHPRRSIGKRLITAVLVAGATTIVRSLTMIFMKRTVQRRLLPANTIEMEIIEPAR
jgi:ElaB/YqjD/DUF883 family membrane-anchored ribosome-binding protein